MKAGGFVDVDCDLKKPNFAAMAEAMGIKGIRVEKPQEREEAITSFLSAAPPQSLHFMFWGQVSACCR